MANKLVIPSILSQNTENIPFGMVVFLQAVQDGLNTIDNNTVYKDSITVMPPTPRIRALSAQGQSYSVSGTNLASGDDYAALVKDVRAILESQIEQGAKIEQLITQLQGR